MTANKPAGDGNRNRNGALRDRSQTHIPAGKWVKRNSDSGRFIDMKTTDMTPFKGVTKERK